MMAARIDKAVETCLSLFAGWPRRYNYWNGSTWLTDRAVVAREEAVEMVKRRLPIGIYKCFKDGESDCAYRDVVVFELDVAGCENMQCVVERARPTVGELLVYLSSYPRVVWYNGHKSIYVAIPIEAVDARYPIQREWVVLAKDLGLDVTQLVSTSAFRLPCVPHQKTGRLGVFLDDDLKPLKEPPAVARRANPFSFVTPGCARPAPRRRQSQDANLLDKIKKLVEEHPRLREDCRLRLAVFIAYACASEGLSLEECLKFAEGLGARWERRHLRELERRYAHFAAVGDAKLSYKVLVSGNAWYSVAECL